MAGGGEPDEVGEVVIVAAAVVVAFGADAVAGLDVPSGFAVEADAFAAAGGAFGGGGATCGPVGRESAPATAAYPRFRSVHRARGELIAIGTDAAAWRSGAHSIGPCFRSQSRASTGTT